MKKKRTQRLIFCLFGALMLSGCGSNVSSGTEGNSTEESGSSGSETAAATASESSGSETAAVTASESSGSETAATDSSLLLDTAELFTNRDYQITYDTESYAEILLEEDTASCGSNAVQIDGSTVTITDEGTYVLSGTLADGTIIVAAEKSDKVQLVFQNVSVASSSSAALYIRQADKVFVTLADGSENTLQNGGTFETDSEDNIDAVIFSKEDLTLNGNGSLTVESPAGHGIVSKDDLAITGGTYTVTAAGQGLSGKDSVRIADGIFSIAAGTDGIHSENEEDDTRGFVFLQDGVFDITAEGDGISASGVLLIQGGEFSIAAGGGSANGSQDHSSSWGQYPGSGSRGQAAGDDSGTSMKGIKAGKDLEISGGGFSIDAADDGIHANGSITINGGDLTIASGDDGFHADESLTISTGALTISESYEGLEGLHITVTGGTITITASDDGINAAGGADDSGSGGRDGRFGGGWNTSSDGSLLISGGTVQIHASGDAIDANGTMEMTGGTILTSGPNQGDTSILDYDLTGTISGGTFFGVGSSMMAENFSDAETQGVIMATFSSQEAGTTITLSDQNGTVLAERQADLEFSCVILSCPEILQGETYTLTVGSDTQTITIEDLIVSTANGRSGQGSFGRHGGW